MFFKPMNNPYTDITPETYPMRIIINIMRVKMFRFSCRLHKKDLTLQIAGQIRYKHLFLVGLCLKP